MHEPKNLASEPPDPEVTHSSLTPEQLIAVLSNQTRLEVLSQLAAMRKSVLAIARSLELDKSSVSHALRTLADAQLVRYESVKKNHFYQLTGAIRVTVRDSTLNIEVASTTGEITFKRTLPL